MGHVIRRQTLSYKNPAPLCPIMVVARWIQLLAPYDYIQKKTEIHGKHSDMRVMSNNLFNLPFLLHMCQRSEGVRNSNAHLIV